MIRIGYIGLGKIGYPISGNISKHFNVNIWNRTKEIGEKHSKVYNSKHCNNLDTLVNESDVIMTCLPTVSIVKNIIDNIYPSLREDQIIIDNTTSDPNVIKNISKKLKKKKVHLLDAPVSGGPEKAKLGTLACMVGGDKTIYNRVEPILKTISEPQYVGEIGNGCAIKVINNILNVTNLSIVAEGLKALIDYGIDIETALNVINKSSGRSLMSIERFPKHIIEGNYNYGFDIGLMKKDVDIAMTLIDDPIILKPVSNLLQEAINNYGDKVDYTEVTKKYFIV